MYVNTILRNFRKNEIKNFKDNFYKKKNIIDKYWKKCIKIVILTFLRNEKKEVTKV